jgi:hypothetical protein
MDTINIYLAICWILRSWNYYLSNTTVYNCFQKSTLFTTLISLPTVITPPDLLQLYKQVLKAGNIQDFIAISNFLNLDEELVDIEDSGYTIGQEDILNKVLDEHLGFQSNQDDDEEDEQPEQPVRILQDAQQALQVLIDYTETQEALQADHLRALERLEAAIAGIALNSRVQSTLDRWIT